MSTRARFHIPQNAQGEDLVYLAGNSLGLQARTVEKSLQREIDRWKTDAVLAHFQGENPWVQYAKLLRPALARITGSKESEVVAMNSLTTNLHLLLTSFYAPTDKRHKILLMPNGFPSDRYAAASHAATRGYKDALVETSDYKRALQKGNIALVLTEGVHYLTGEAYPLEEITYLAHKAGAVMGLDLAHAVGNIPLNLHDWGVDFAVWCSYKYLNGGPGAVGGAFVHERHGEKRDLPRLAGWWGHDDKTRFEMGPEFKPSSGALGWQQSTPPVLALAALRASLEIFDDVGLATLIPESRRLTSALESILRAPPFSKVEILTPKNRGSQLTLRLPHPSAFQSLLRQGVVCDWREPGVIRVALAPLYNTLDDVECFVSCLKEAL